MKRTLAVLLAAATVLQSSGRTSWGAAVATGFGASPNIAAGSLDAGHPSSIRKFLLSYWEPGDFHRIVAAAQAAGLGKLGGVSFGSYGISGEDSGLLHGANPRFSYSPAFTLKRNTLWDRRRLSRDEEKLLPGKDLPLAGRIPSQERLLAMGSTERHSWGIELGQRFRDHIRAVRRTGVTIETWQFDELLGEASGPSGRPIRELTAAILFGLAFGRPALGDKPRKGILWLAQTSMRLVYRPLDPELSRFWGAVNASTRFIAGEEYPVFTGDPAAAARRGSAYQARLLRSGGVRAELGRKYLVGLSPGYIPIERGLGGKTSGMSGAQVRHWRQAYVRARACEHAAGFAMYNFRHENRGKGIIREAVEDIGIGVRTARCR